MVNARTVAEPPTVAIPAGREREDEKDVKESDSDNESPARIEDVRLTPVPTVNLATEKALMRKLDKRLIPMIMWMYLMSFMDRVNIGNARLYGLEEDLGMVGTNQYVISVSVLFITYCLFEAPSNMVLKQLRPRWYLAALTFAWGMVATFSAFVQDFAGLVACRLLLGLFEAGLFPGLVVYLTIFYNKRQIALRTAYLFATAAISGAAGGLVAYAIGFLDNNGEGTAGWRAWRWIFLINGLLTVVTAFVVPFVLSDKPESTKFLSEEDRRNMVLLRQAEVGQTISGQEFSMKDAKEAFKDWKIYAMAVGQYCSNTMLYSFSIFLPTIINQIGTWNVAEVQLLTIPIFTLAAALYIGFAMWSDKLQIRGPFVIAFTLVSIVGYILLITNANPGAALTGTFLVGAGCYLAVGMPMAWLTSNNPRYGKRSTANGIQLTIGNSAGVAAPFLFPAGDEPNFYTGYGVSIGLLCLSTTIFTCMHFYWKRRNHNKRAGKEDWMAEGLSEEEAKELGDKNPNYFFTT